MEVKKSIFDNKDYDLLGDWKQYWMRTWEDYRRFAFDVGTKNIVSEVFNQTDKDWYSKTRKRISNYYDERGYTKDQKIALCYLNAFTLGLAGYEGFNIDGSYIAKKFKLILPQEAINSLNDGSLVKRFEGFDQRIYFVRAIEEGRMTAADVKFLCEQAGISTPYNILKNVS